MILKMVDSCPCQVDTVIRFVKENTAPQFSCPTLQAAYEAAYAGDDTTLAAGSLKTYRLRLKENHFVNLLVMGFDCSRPSAFDDFRKALNKIGAELNALKAKKVFFDSVTKLVFADKEEIVRQVGMTLPLSEYAFDKYMIKKAEITPKEVYLLGDAALEAALQEGASIAEGIHIARDLVNEPAEDLTPAELAKRAEELGKQYGFETEIFDDKACEAMGMGAFLAVGRASVNKPKLIVMRYHGNGNAVAKGIIGKGLCYDSGGLYLKNGAGMSSMKGDMAGSAAVIGAMCAIAANKLKENVVTVVAACENMVDGAGYRNGDIVHTMAGKSVFVASTDAEGRLTMADAITYIIRKENIDSIIELSTLTGSCANFFGKVCAGALSTDDAMFEKVASKSRVTGEKYGRMPAYDEYREYIKSDIADLYNSSAEGAGGICAGLFLDEFKEDKPFLHLDVAGMTFAKSKSEGQPAGGTGFGVKTVYQYIKG
ncbi:leucyl aminopeptidase family protein [Acidaminobacterium chupaoyuni]